jgi:DNA polymerase/3'-5' exonuclease PolX
MKKYTLITEHHLSYEYPSEGEDLLSAARCGGKTFTSLANMFGKPVVTLVTYKILRTKVKKGFGKGRTRVVKCKLL